jgi:hypothetical protein
MGRLHVEVHCKYLPPDHGLRRLAHCPESELSPARRHVVGIPYTFDYLAGAEFSQIQELFQQLGLQLTLSFTLTAGSLPPGITPSSSFLSFSGTPTAAGTYVFTVGLRELLVDTASGQTLFDYSAPISNRGQQAQTATVSTNTNSGGGAWLSASGGGSVAPFSSSSVVVSANPSSLPVGTYTGTLSISLSPSGQTSKVAVTATVSSAKQQIVVSQSGLRFQTVAGGGAPSSQSIAVLNSGAGSLNFSVSASTLSGAQGWFIGIALLRYCQSDDAGCYFSEC